MAPAMRCVSPLKEISSMAMLKTLKAARKNVFRIINAKYSLFGLKRTHIIINIGAKRITSVFSGPPMAIKKLPLMNVIIRISPNLGNIHEGGRQPRNLRQTNHGENRFVQGEAGCEGIGCGNGGVEWGWGVSGNFLRVRY